MRNGHLEIFAFLNRQYYLSLAICFYEQKFYRKQSLGVPTFLYCKSQWVGLTLKSRGMNDLLYFWFKNKLPQFFLSPTINQRI